MANIKAGNSNIENQSSFLHREQRRVRIMQVAFAVFCIVLILSMVLSLVVNS